MVELRFSAPNNFCNVALKIAVVKCKFSYKCKSLHLVIGNVTG